MSLQVVDLVALLDGPGAAQECGVLLAGAGIVGLPGRPVVLVAFFAGGLEHACHTVELGQATLHADLKCRKF